MLLDRDGEKADIWTATDGSAIDNAAHPLVPYEVLPEALLSLRADTPLGIVVPNTVTADALAPHLSRLALIAISFPAFADGRGFSIARALRSAGFQRILRARGPLIPDQFAYALACGFDEIELPEASANRQCVQQWQLAANWNGDAYQRGYLRDGSILDRRRSQRRV